MSEGAGDAPLIPLLVDGSGRDGTTLTMQLLGTAPEIAFDRIYPYERRYFSYLLHWARLPTSEYVESKQWNLDSLSHSASLREIGTAGPLPWVDRSLIGGEREPAFWRQAFDAAWAAFSSRARAAVRERLGDQALPVRYYAQKNADSWELPVDELPPLKVLRVLRDPRDIWLSSLAFHRRRVAEGDSFLAIEPGGSEEDALRAFIPDMRARLRWLLEVEEREGADSPLVRYESLVADLAAEAERLGAWLGVRLDADRKSVV